MKTSLRKLVAVAFTGLALLAGCASNKSTETGTTAMERAVDNYANFVLSKPMRTIHQYTSVEGIVALSDKKYESKN